MERVHYRRSFPVRIAKVILEKVHERLPEGIYRFLYYSLRHFLWFFHRLGVKVRYVLAILLNKNQEEKKKIFLVDKLLPYTMGGPLALSSTFDVAAMAEKKSVEGALVECGVAKGGCAAIMHLASRYHGGQRHLWLFDSYEGLPEPTEKDFREGKAGNMVGPLAAGMLAGSIKQVRELMINVCGLPEEKIHLVKGWFEDTLPKKREVIGNIAVLRIDGDWYESVKCCLENLYRNMTPGGFIIIDDYATCYGAERAVSEFLQSKNIKVELNPDGRGGVWFRIPER